MKIISYITIAILGILATPFILAFLIMTAAFGVAIVMAGIGLILAVVGGLVPILLMMVPAVVFIIMISELMDK